MRSTAARTFCMAASLLCRRRRLDVYDPVPLLLPVHITAGGLAIILGAVALLSSKGATLHRRSGALFIAAGSLFSIRVARILPEPLTTRAMRALPVVLIFLAMFYW